MEDSVTLTSFVHIPRVPDSAWFWQFLGGKTLPEMWGIVGAWAPTAEFNLRQQLLILPRASSSFSPPLPWVVQCKLPLFLCVISPITGCLSIPKYGPLGQCSDNLMRDAATNRKTKIVSNIIQMCWTKDHPQPSVFLLGHQSHTPPR